MPFPQNFQNLFFDFVLRVTFPLLKGIAKKLISWKQDVK